MSSGRSARSTRRKGISLDGGRMEADQPLLEREKRERSASWWERMARKASWRG